MNLGGVWIAILDLDIYIPHKSQWSPVVALGPEKDPELSQQIGA